MALDQEHEQSRKQRPLRAAGFSRTVSGSLVASSGVISGLPAKHRIAIGDTIDISVAGPTPTGLEQGVVAASDMSGYLGGLLGNIAYLRVDHALSLFDFPGTYPDQATALAAIRAVFTLGTTIYFNSGIFAGASINVGEITTAPGVTVHDDTTPGLSPGYWYIIVDLSTGSGFPALAAFPSETTVSPAVDILNSSGGSINLTDLLVSALPSSTSIQIASGLVDIASFPDLTVNQHSRIDDKLITADLETQTLQIGGVPVIAGSAKIPYSGTVANLKLLWEGKSDTGAAISNTEAHSPEISPTDVFNVGVDIAILQMVTHPMDNSIVVMLYQDLVDTFFYLKCFKFTYENGFDNAYTPIQIAGADSSDMKIGFATTYSQTTGAILSASLYVFGGKSSPGTSIYGGIYVVNTTTLDITASVAWADTGSVIGSGTFTNIGRIHDAKKQSVSAEKRLAVTYDNYAAVMLVSDIFTVDFSTPTAEILYSTDVIVPQTGSEVLAVKRDTACLITSTGDGSVEVVPDNTYAEYEASYSGASYGNLRFYDLSGYKGVTGETKPIGSFSNFMTNDVASAISFDPLPYNFQNGSGREENVVLPLGTDKLLFYKSYGYYAIVERHTGSLIYLGRIGSNSLGKSSIDTTVIVNGDTVLYSPGSWTSVRFLPNGPFVAYAKSGTDAIVAPSGARVQTTFNLDKHKEYYASYKANGISVSLVVDNNPVAGGRKVGFALDTNLFLSEINWVGHGRTASIPKATVNQAVAMVSDRVFMTPARTKDLVDNRAIVMRWRKYSITLGGFLSWSWTGDYSGYVAISVDPGTMIEKLMVKHSVAFAGGTLSAATASAGQSGNHTLYTPALNIFAAPTPDGVEVTDLNIYSGSGLTIHVYVELTGETHYGLSAGVVDLWLLAATIE